MSLYRLGLSTLLLCALANLAQGQSFGRWHVPSTPGQFFGCGNSAGHHAPLVRMPGGKPLYVPRLAFVPPRDRMPDSGKYPASAYQSFDYAPTYPTGCNTGNCVSHASPQVYYQQQTPQPTLAAPVANQPIFSAPAAKPKKPVSKKSVLKKPTVKKPAAKKQTLKKKSQPRRSATPKTVNPRRQKPARPPIKKNTLPEPPMPTTDPLATPDNHQATYDFTVE